MQTRREAEEGFSFTTWLRTGRMTWTDPRWRAREVKFNPNHDPKDGRAKDLREGKHVSVDITAHYLETSKRPNKLRVEWSINGFSHYRNFFNEPKGQNRGR